MKRDAQSKELSRAKEMARLIVRHHFGSKSRRITHKTAGLSNFVFAAVHAEGNFIVRISFDPSRINLFIKEQWTQEKAHELGVPTAEILEVGNDVIGHPFMISRTIKGHEATYNPNRLQIIREMGRYAALINTIPTSGFGNSFDWSSNQLSRNETFAEFLDKELQIESRLKILEKQKILAAPQIKKLRGIFKEAVKSNPSPRLNHGDIRLKNIIVTDAGEIKAVIDWEHAASNLAPEWELSLALHDLSIDEKQEFLEGYGLAEKKFREIAPLVKAFNIINYAPEIGRLAEAKDTVKLEQYQTRLSGALDLYSLPQI
jgi:hygromycin-B 4-O-kinase